MVRCKICRQDMNKTAGCGVKSVFCNGKKYTRVPVTGNGRCTDCGALPGRYHHFGCDQEICPACKRQLRSCHCEDVHFVGVPESKKTQEELFEKFSWLELNPAEWEIALLTDELICCNCAGKDLGSFVIYMRETKEKCKEDNEAFKTFNDTLLNVIMGRIQPEYISFAAEEHLIQMKRKLLEELSSKK